MNSRKREISVTPTGRKENEFLVVSIRYNEGGINYWNYETEARGLYVEVSVEKRERWSGGTTRSFAVGRSGLKRLLEPAPRFNAKRLAAIVPDAALVENMTVEVLRMSAEKEAQS